MQTMRLLLIVAAAGAPASAVSVVAGDVAAGRRSTVVVGDGLSPITRVVELLKGLSAKIEEESQIEQSLYQKFACWAQTNIGAKTASNAEAQSRIDSLTTYIKDIEAGRIEFTTERVDLEKEIAGLSQDLETAAALRAREHGEYQDASAEMQAGIVALEKAIALLTQATGGARGQLLAVKGSLRAGAGFAARSAEAAQLVHAADLADRALSRGDARFLRRLLTGDVPTWDWKKLNRKATFKTTYKARSTNIQSTLAKLLVTFNTNLKEASTKEAEAQAFYDKLAASKGAQKATAEDALLKLVKENGARGMSKADAQAEVDAFTKQVADDTKFIQQVTTSMNTKKGEWAARSELRSKELAAISEAISILHSDDARDLFKKSLKSQGYSFLQLRADRDAHRAVAVAKRAASELRRAASATQDARLTALALRLRSATEGQFTAVLQAIDMMVTTLQQQETDELQTKEKCEKARADGTRDAVVASRAIDEMTDKMASLTADIEQIDKDITEKNEAITDLEKQWDAAERLRADAASARAKERADDVAAKGLVDQARRVLSAFYTNNNLLLVVKRQTPSTAALGQAPLPPPATWDAPYGGKTGESSGVVAILQLISEDMQKDIDTGDAAEQQAVRDHQALGAQITGDTTNLESEITVLESTKSQKEGDIQNTQVDQTSKKGELEVTMTKLKDLQAGCDYVSVNFAVRSSNRQIEIDGLLKAKAYLQGAEFSKPADDSRALRPGDAFLQRH